MNNRVTKSLKKKYRTEEKKIEKKFGYTSTNSSIEFCNYWQEMWHYINDNEIPTTNDNFGNLVEVLIKEPDAVSLNLMEIDEHGFVTDSKQEIICWRYFKSANIGDNYFSVL